jgi:putative transcriptional regulator
MNEPKEWMMLAGKSAWAPGQLEAELEQNCWLTLDAVPAIVYTSGTDQLWDLCVDLCGQEMINTYF